MVAVLLERNQPHIAKLLGGGIILPRPRGRASLSAGSHLLDGLRDDPESLLSFLRCYRNAVLNMDAPRLITLSLLHSSMTTSMSPIRRSRMRALETLLKAGRERMRQETPTFDFLLRQSTIMPSSSIDAEKKALEREVDE